MIKTIKIVSGISIAQNRRRSGSPARNLRLRKNQNPRPYSLIRLLRMIPSIKVF